jgi:hypothetical protein
MKPQNIQNFSKNVTARETADQINEHANIIQISQNYTLATGKQSTDFTTDSHKYLMITFKY